MSIPMSIPADLKYTQDHEWVRQGAAEAVIGITHHAQHQLGDVVFVELPEVGSTVTQGASFGTVESVKAVSDLLAPISGEVVAVNEALVDSPEQVNTDPYGAGWMIKIRPSDPSEASALLGATQYEQVVNADG